MSQVSDKEILVKMYLGVSQYLQLGLINLDRNHSATGFAFMVPLKVQVFFFYDTCSGRLIRTDCDIQNVLMKRESDVTGRKMF